MLLSAVLSSAGFSARAALSCTPNGVYLDMFAGSYGGFFSFPSDFADVAIGARIGPLREVNLRYRCTNNNTPPTTTQFGTGMKAAVGLTYHAATQTYTNPQLEAYGLGFRIWWHEPNGTGGANLAAHSNSNPMVDALPDTWYPIPGSPFNLNITTRVIFFKINNNFQNTDGAYNPVSPNIVANLFRFYVTRPAAPTVVHGTRYDYNLALNTFSSKKRVCTPFVDQLIRFDYKTVADMPATPGPVEASTKGFSLTFHCPYMAYYWVGFRLVGAYPVLDQANGVFGIKQGAGYAQGVGIQVLAENVAPGWMRNPNYASPFQVLIPNQQYAVPWFEYSENQIHLDPAVSERTRVVNFRARYYRMPGTLTGGKVESAVIFHFVYQ